ncbi:hypothetical protein [Granulicella sp. dw_53]|uniref:hypothetical protein n=1 Tax=Granulicella sp. dw_53 TaxID=2719792 RepID=UPI001BD664CB|nr:hypothetical protein [Granulicella sp. dw_53]
MKDFIIHAVKNWHSTVQSILTSTLAITGGLAGLSILSPQTATILGTVNVIAKIGLGMLQTDGIVIPAGSTVSQTQSVTVKTP